MGMHPVFAPLASFGRADLGVYYAVECTSSARLSLGAAGGTELHESN